MRIRTVTRPTRMPRQHIKRRYTSDVLLCKNDVAGCDWMIFFVAIWDLPCNSDEIKMNSGICYADFCIYYVYLRVYLHIYIYIYIYIHIRGAHIYIYMDISAGPSSEGAIRLRSVLYSQTTTFPFLIISLSVSC